MSLLGKFTKVAIVAPLLCGTAFAFGTGTQQQQSGSSLDQLRNRCKALRQDTQVKDFSIKIECAGRFTSWHTDQSEAPLKNSSNMSTQTTTKSGRFSTGESQVCRRAGNDKVGCERYVQVAMTSPEGMGIPVVIEDCDQLTTENVEAICKAEVQKYCQANHTVADGKEVQSQAKNKGGKDGKNCGDQEGMCVLAPTGKVIDTCSAFN